MCHRIIFLLSIVSCLYFSTIASDIGGNHVISLTENEFNNHSSVQMIETISVVILHFNSNI